MISVKSMQIRDNFKNWCNQVADGETVQILRPGKNSLYIINQETYENLNQARRLAAYTSYVQGKDKITNLRRLSEIQGLTDNWNNNGASAFSDALINDVRRIMMSVSRQPEIFPTACDSIQLEWDKKTGEYLEMEVSENDITVFYIAADGSEKQWKLTTDIDSINDTLGEFYDGTL